MFNDTALSPWRARRKFMYMVGAGVIAFGILLLLFFKIIFPTTNCFDGRKNGGERGIDCGGRCARQCMADVQPVAVEWTRVLEVTDNVWSAVSLIQNRNNLTTQNLAYTMSLYDASNALIGKKTGVAFVPALTQMPIFVGGFEVGDKVPQFATLSFTYLGDWYAPPASAKKVALSVTNVSFQNNPTADAAELTARISNSSLYTLKNVPVSALIHDTSGNVIGASETYIDTLEGAGSADIVFTWPRQFTENLGIKDVLPRFDALVLPR